MKKNTILKWVALGLCVGVGSGLFCKYIWPREAGILDWKFITVCVIMGILSGIVIWLLDKFIIKK